MDGFHIRDYERNVKLKILYIKSFLLIMKRLLLLDFSDWTPWPSQQNISIGWEPLQYTIFIVCHCVLVVYYIKLHKTLSQGLGTDVTD
jgi:hypothetical protein